MVWHEYCDRNEEERFEPFGDESETLIGTKIIHTTDKAVLIRHCNRQAWFPKAVVHTLEKDCIEYLYTFDPTWKSIDHQRMPAIGGDFE